MAKYRHRIFEMYEFRDEAMRALMPKTEKTATEATAPETWSFTQLLVSREEDVICIQFGELPTSEDAIVPNLREDFARLADLLGRDSRILFDFSGVASFDAAAISELVKFYRNLQIKGSRIALCCLEPTARESFFATG